MKTKIKCIIYLITAVSLFFMLLNSCIKDENLPSIDTIAIIKITQSTAICRGFIFDNGGATISEKGFCWSTSQNPIITDSKIVVKSDSLNFTDTIAGLNPNITYYIRSYAINSIGIAYGGEQSFTLWINTPGPNATDIDGNNYTSVKIGPQVWMVENLKTTKYRNGDLIGTTIPATLDIRSENTPKYQWAYDGNENNVPTYGRLYTWYAVNDSRSLAPIGWHVALKADWEKLVDYLGGELIPGSKLKEIGSTHWIKPNTGATNESGFSALPSGIRLESGPFGNIGYVTYWWSSTECIGCANKAGIDWYVGYNFSEIYWSGDNASLGGSVRCVKD
jgi:uncharacterized protein (TIGR02145 family)